MHRYAGDISLVLGGSAGQGIQTVEALLVAVLKREGYHVFACKEYMSRIRGGSNSTEIRITSKKRSAYVRHIDFLFALDKGVVPHLKERLCKKTLVFGELEKIGAPSELESFDIPFTKFTNELGNPIFASTIAVGVVLGLLQAPFEDFEMFLKERFARKGEEIVTKNLRAARMGYDHGTHLAYDAGIEIHLSRHQSVKDDLLMEGVDALGLGVLAAGCNYISSYPMSPGTGLLTFLAKHHQEFEIIVDQAEDEIAAINQGLGAWYAGARAVVTTSGGGFALMTEGVSLAGIIETPIVIHIGQRPGPATGLPTKTEQADLNLALYAGHGEFPRVIFAPGTPEEIFSHAQRAFSLADEFQIPTFILTDQFILDSVESVPEEKFHIEEVKNFIVETKEDYKRYTYSDNGISPRGIPGYGAGLVGVDSDEHDEEAHITESHEVRQKMQDKRLIKVVELKKRAYPPTKIGVFKDAEYVVVSWGSNRGVLEEALDIIDNEVVAGLHFSQVYPLSDSAEKLLKNKKVIVLENNAGGQFANLLQLEADIVADERILQYDGAPFAVEDVVKKIKEIVL
jgi:2-oxoglutarate/2-oxoacid ferredoxin oxidoreductase subunit alpha